MVNIHSVAQLMNDNVKISNELWRLMEREQGASTDYVWMLAMLRMLNDQFDQMDRMLPRAR